MKRLNIFQFIVFGFSLMIFSCRSQTNLESYSIEAVNDSLIFVYPNPVPVHPVSYSFSVKREEHWESIQLSSTNLRNLSVSIENTGHYMIEDPYLFGPRGYDFRDLSALASKITEGELTPEEKFFRVHEWFSYHYDRFGTRSGEEAYGYDNYFGNPLRLINQYGGSMCGNAVQATAGLLYFVPPVGEMYARKVQMHRHQTGEAWFDGAWHNFDASPEIRWIYYNNDNRTITPFWKNLKDEGGLIQRIKPWAGWDIWRYVEEASCEPFEILREVGKQWRFRYKLRPDEKFTMYFGMRGRTEQKSRNYRNSAYNSQNPGVHRNPCDYASAVFTYKPDLTTTLHRKYVVEEENIRWTRRGLVSEDQTKLSSITFPVTSTWNIVGADINAEFFTSGMVYFAVTEAVGDTAYSENLQWHLLQPDTFESASAGVEGRMAYWVKFEFEGKGSGLADAEISTEVQMNPYTMPGLLYGENNILFSAAKMNGSSAEITFQYDDQSKYNFYEPATSDYGRHIFYRVGGNHTKTWSKPLFYRNIKQDPDGGIPVKVEIFRVSGDHAGQKVRSLKDECMKYGTYWWYWDGRDDQGEKCPVGMYSWKVTGEVGEGEFHTGNEYGERLYLYDRIWPVPNEVSKKDPLVVSTFESISVYWSPELGSADKDALIRFRESGHNRWHEGLAMSYNPIDSTDQDLTEYRGSIVNLKPGTRYEIELGLEGSKVKKVIHASTWSEDFPVGKVIRPGKSTQQIHITESGTADAYILIDGTGTSIDVNNKEDYCLNISGDYIIVRGFELVGGKKGLIKLNDCHDVVIEHCDMTRWGEMNSYGYGENYQAAIYSESPSLERVVIQRNRIHHPRYGANSWAEQHHAGGSNHPAGPQGVSFWNSAGNHVIRYNEIWSDKDHKYNDILGFGANFSYEGFPGPDSDIYGNYLANSYDDAIESEGGNRNVRIWDNYTDDAYMHIANVATSIGPLYIWGNVAGSSYSPPGSSYGEYAMFLKMGENGDWMQGMIYVFNNTLLNFNEDGPGGIGTSEGEPVRGLRKLTTRNNILWVREKGHSFSLGYDRGGNDLDYDLCSGKYPEGYEQHGREGKPVFTRASGFDYVSKTANFQLSSTGPGIDAGVVIPNFRESYTGDAPDMGAFESGQPPKEYGVNAYPEN